MRKLHNVIIHFIQSLRANCGYRLLKERAEERQMEELQRMQEVAGGKKSMNRVEWLYGGPAAGETQTTEEMENFLLGRRRLDVLIKQPEEKKPNGIAANGNNTGMVAPNVRDIATKTTQDPLLAIKSQEMANVQAAMQAAKRRSEKETKRGKERGHRHHKHRERSRSPRRRTDGYREDYERSRRSHRHHRQRARSYTRSPSRSRSPEPQRRRRYSKYSSDSRSRSPIPSKHSRYRDRREERREYNRSFSRSPSRSPQRNGRSYRNGDSHASRFRQRSPPLRARSPPRKEGDEEDKKARKLAAMQANASSMEDGRRQRLDDADRKDREERQKDERGRTQQGKFLGDLRRKELDRVRD